MSLGVEAHDIVAIHIPGTNESAVRGGGNVIKAGTTGVLQFTQLLTRHAFKAQHIAPLDHVDVSLSVGSQATKRHLGIDGPLRHKLARRVKHLNASTDVFANVNIAGAIDRYAARVFEHPWPNSFRAKLQQNIGNTGTCCSFCWGRYATKWAGSALGLERSK